MLPLIPLLCLFAIGGGASGLAWYYSLPASKKVEADSLAVSYARIFFNKAVEELTKEEKEQVYNKVKGRFAS